MTDQVQHLIERIRKDAVDTAKGQAAQVQQQARDDAQRLVEAAQAQATAIVAEAEQKAQALVDRGGKALDQAARDLLIGVGQRLQAMIDALLVTATKEALRPEVVEHMLLRLCAAMAKSGLDEKGLLISVSPGDRDQIAQFAMGKLRESLQQGAEVHIDQHLQRGFRISFANDTVRHDFTPAAIAAALSQFVRPQLAEVIQRAAIGQPAPARGAGKP